MKIFAFLNALWKTQKVQKYRIKYFHSMSIRFEHLSVARITIFLNWLASHNESHLKLTYVSWLLAPAVEVRKVEWLLLISSGQVLGIDNWKEDESSSDRTWWWCEEPCGRVIICIVSWPGGRRWKQWKIQVARFIFTNKLK